MKKFKDWFESCVTMAKFPTIEELDDVYRYVDYAINVSDEFRPEIYFHVIASGRAAFWFPMNEKKRDIGLNAIYAACVVLSHAEEKGSKVLIHCHGGINRSWTAAQAYYYVRSKEHLQGRSLVEINQLLQNSIRGYLPPKRELEEFSNCVGECIGKDGYKTGNLDYCKSSIKNF